LDVSGCTSNTLQRTKSYLLSGKQIFILFLVYTDDVDLSDKNI